MEGIAALRPLPLVKTEDKMADKELSKMKPDELIALIEELEAKNAKLIADNDELRSKLGKSASAREALIAACKKAGKGEYCIEPFLNDHRNYKPGEKINPENIKGDIKKLREKGLTLEVK